MTDPAPQAIRTHRAARPSAEVERVKALYVRGLRERIRNGSYFSPERVDRALDRLLEAVRQDLPEDPIP